MNYGFPDDLAHINDYSTEYLSEFRGTFFVTPRTPRKQMFAAFPDYRVMKTEEKRSKLNRRIQWRSL